VPERSQEIEQVVRDWLDAKQAADGDAIRAGLSGYDHALAIGTEAGEASGLPVRLTLVLVREDEGRWHIVQSHASIPEA
jgi:ketosteroid isomerase-like protein